jgi:hypothetical protein
VIGKETSQCRVGEGGEGSKGSKQFLKKGLRQQLGAGASLIAESGRFRRRPCIGAYSRFAAGEGGLSRFGLNVPLFSDRSISAGK